MILNRKTLLLSLGFLFLVGGTVTVILKNRLTTQVTPPSLPSLPPPSFGTSLDEEKGKTSLALTEKDLQLPLTLNVYSLSHQDISLQEANTIATRLGFNAPPTILDDINLGQIFVWYDPGSLRIVSRRGIIDYKSGIPPQGGTKEQFDQNQLITQATTFINTYQFLASGFEFDQIKFTNQYIGDPDRPVTTDSQSNQVAQVLFRQTINSYPIVNLTPDIGTATITLDSQGSVVQAFIDQVGTLTLRGVYTIKTYRELIESLDQATIQSLNLKTSLPGESLPENIRRITINRVEIAYLQENDPNQTIIQPIFILTGDALLTDNTLAPTTLYLPALTADNYKQP